MNFQIVLPQIVPRVRGVACLALAAGLSACVSIPKDRGADAIVSQINKVMPSDAPLRWPNLSADAQSRALIAVPLTPQSTQQLALLRNPEMQLLYADLGLSWAEVADATRISNPIANYERLRPRESGVLSKITYGLTQNLSDFLLLGARKRLAQGELKRSSAQITAQVLNLARDAEVAYYQLIGAEQVRSLRDLSAKSMQNSADLAQRFFDAGNITRGQLASEKAGAAASQIALEHANAGVFAARAALNALLALPADDTQLKVEAKLPELASAEDASADLQALAKSQRADLVAADIYLASAQDVARSAKRWRWLGALEVGYARDREDDGARFAGLSLSLGIPIFNQGQASVLRASAYAEKAAAMRARTVLQVQSEVQSAAAQLASARKMVEIYRNKLLPAREAVVAAQQRRFNFMLIGAFELMQGKRDEYDAYQGYLEALSQYWTARATLARAIGGALPSDKNIGKAAVGLPASPDADAGMQGMDMSGSSDSDMQGMDMDMGGANDSSMPGMDMSDKAGNLVDPMLEPDPMAEPETAIPTASPAPKATIQLAPVDETKPVYVCPMHEHLRSNNASDKCPICGMSLELETQKPSHQHEGGAP